MKTIIEPIINNSVGAWLTSTLSTPFEGNHTKENYYAVMSDNGTTREILRVLNSQGEPAVATFPTRAAAENWATFGTAKAGFDEKRGICITEATVPLPMDAESVKVRNRYKKNRNSRGELYYPKRKFAIEHYMPLENGSEHLVFSGGYETKRQVVEMAEEGFKKNPTHRYEIYRRSDGVTVQKFEPVLQRIEKQKIGAVCAVVSLDDIEHEGETGLIGQRVTVVGYLDDKDEPGICLTESDPLITCKMADGTEREFYKENLKPALQWVDDYGAIPGETVSETPDAIHGELVALFGIVEAPDSTDENPKFELWHRIHGEEAEPIGGDFQSVDAAKGYAERYEKYRATESVYVMANSD